MIDTQNQQKTNDNESCRSTGTNKITTHWVYVIEFKRLEGAHGKA